MLSELPVEIETARFKLKTITAADVSQVYLSWFSDNIVKRFILGARESQTLATLQNFVTSKWKAADCLFLGIYDSAGQHIGNLKFEPVSFETGCAVMGILIGDANWRGKGVGPEVINGGAQFLKTKFGIKFIELGVEKDNASAIRSYEKMGFIIVADGQFIHPKSESLAMRLSLPS